MLLDTGADICLIKLNCLKDNTLIHDSHIIELQGIHEQIIKTLGRTVLTLRLGNLTKEFYFHVVTNGFKLRTDGVIGRNLLNDLKANIDYGDRTLRIGLNKIPLTNPDIKIPPRSEQVVQVFVNNNGEGLIEEQELTPGVYITNTIVNVRINKAQVVLINTANHEVDASNIHCTLERLDTDVKLIAQSKVEDYLKTDHLRYKEVKLLTEICNEFRDIFYLPVDKLTATSTIKHEIPLLRDTPPLHERQYRIPQTLRTEVDRQVQKMLDEGIVRHSTSPYNAPIVVVPKKSDNSGQRKWRLAVDFRKLNDVIIGDSYPLPNITEIIDQLGNSKYYTPLDLASGYHQIQITEGDKHKTAFSTSHGHLEFNRMPFGLKEAPAVFQRLMNAVLSGLIGNTCFVYLDDIVIYSKTLEEHRKKLIKVFSRLRQHKLMLQPDKCNFFMSMIKYLGHIISENGVRPDPDKINVVLKYPVPETPKQIKAFLGLVGYYRRFIPNFAVIANPLNNLLRKDVPFNWDKEHVNAFEKLSN